MPQKAVIFSGTIESNIAFGENGKPAPAADAVAKAADIAQAADFIEKKPEKYDAPVAQNGTNPVSYTHLDVYKRQGSYPL